MIRHDDVRLHRPSPRLGRKTFVTKRAPALAHALCRRHRHGSPHSRVDLGIEVIPVTGLGVCRPLVNHRRLLFQRSPGPRAGLLLRDQRLLTVGLTHSLPAQIVLAPLQHRPGNVPACLGQARQFPLDQLPLQSKGRRRDHHRALLAGHPRRGHEVGEGLTRPGACLHDDVVAGRKGLHHRLGHLTLTDSGLATHRLDDRLQARRHRITHRTIGHASPRRPNRVRGQDPRRPWLSGGSRALRDLPRPHRPPGTPGPTDHRVRRARRHPRPPGCGAGLRR